MVEKFIDICIFCESEADSYPSMCYNCKDYDGILRVKVEDWNNEELTLQEIIDRNSDENGEEDIRLQ